MTRVLVVEDEESYSDALAYMLRKEGFEVSVANDGHAALAEFDKTGADIVLLDLMLPGIPGTEVCRQIRATSNVPVIMVSAKDAEVDKVVGLELGADDYVTKPFSLRELTARIRAIFRRADQAAAAAVASPDGPVSVHVGRVEVDLAGHRLLRDGDEGERGAAGRWHTATLVPRQLGAHRIVARLRRDADGLRSPACSRARGP